MKQPVICDAAESTGSGRETRQVSVGGPAARFQNGYVLRLGEELLGQS